MSVLAVRGLSKSFGGVQALAEISFAVAAGEIVAVIGPNGAGKSTCFNVIHGQARADSGDVEFLGRSLTGLDTRTITRRGVGRMFQIAQVFGSMTVVENVQLALAARGGRWWAPWPSLPKLFYDEALGVLERMGLIDQADRAASILAYGDLKRVELAMALAGEPRLLLMDEPTSGMAPGERRTMMETVARLAHARSLAVVFTEHDMDVVFAHADRIVVLSRGRVIADGPPAAIRADAGVRQAYLGPVVP